MSIFKCKMCGGTIEFKQGDTVGTCDSCGTIQTLPRLDDDKKSNLYDRANHFRRNNDFDKASSIYEQILSEDSTDAEAYWSLVLCRYGIEYVEDPTTHKRVPTVNRAQFTSIYADEDYKSAIEYADSYQKTIYENEARAIDEIQKGILAISQKEEPFDIFICYKETDNNGRRTMDSVLANDLYHQLTQEGFKVFFSRITLEDKLGTAYEPYIFAALNSAKVMVVLGTKPEYFNAVWVKNEWSRYLTLVKESKGKKVLIPAYRDMDPYDLPEEFSHLQAQDMSKLGFMQDLIRGIKKLVNVSSNTTVIKETTVNNTNFNIETILERAFIFLEDGNFDEADEYCEKVLDQDPKCAQAYIGKLMIDLKVKKLKDLSNQDEPFETNKNYEKIIRFGDETLISKLERFNYDIKTKIEEESNDKLYKDALLVMNSANSEKDFLKVSNLFENLGDYLDSHDKALLCKNMSLEARNEAIYNNANIVASTKSKKLEENIKNAENAIKTYSEIEDFKDSKDKISMLNNQIDEYKKQIVIRDKKKKKREKIALIMIASIAIFIVLLVKLIIPFAKYSIAGFKFKNEEYSTALDIYESIDFKDSKDKVTETTYLLAKQQFENKDYESSYNNFTSLGKYSDSSSNAKNSGYYYAKELMSNDEYDDALNIINKIIKINGSENNNILELKKECLYNGAKYYYTQKNWINAIVWCKKVTDLSEDIPDFYYDSCYQYGKQLCKEKLYDSAIEHFEKAQDYIEDASTQILEAKYLYVKDNKTTNYSKTKVYNYLKELKENGYKDSSTIYEDLYSWKVSIIMNTENDDTTTNLSSVSKYNTWYFHIDVSGGEPNASIKLKYSGMFPGGQTMYGTWDGYFYDGSTGANASFWFNTPANAPTGKFYFKVYSLDGTLLTEKDITITN